MGSRWGSSNSASRSSQGANDGSYRQSYQSYPPPPGLGAPPSYRSSDQRAGRDRYSDSRDGYNQGSQSESRRYNDSGYNRDSFRPPQGDFSFRVERPPGVQDGSSYDSYREPPPFRGDRDSDRRDGGSRYGDGYRPPRRNDNRSRFPGSRNNQGGYQGQRRGGQPPARFSRRAADRLFLHKKHDENVESLLGDTTGRVTYRDVDELTDSEEEAMDISDESGDEDGQPAAKRARLMAADTDVESPAPKWSNPDPYTALPPPDETQRKKKDVVQLIRKARVEAASEKQSVASEAADFISFDFSDDENDQSNKAPTLKGNSGVPNAPTGPRSAVATLPPRPPVPVIKTADSVAQREPSPTLSTPAAANSKFAKAVDLTPSTALGSRKRTADDKIKRPHQKIKRPSKMKADGFIDTAWRVKTDEDPCPWVEADHSSEPSMAVRLHKELVDFYEYVRPRDFEERVRQEMVQKLNNLVKTRWNSASVIPFGSFKSGLYLPTADMDLVMCSKSFLNGSRALFSSTGHLYTLKAFLLRNNVAAFGDIETVAKARVPLLKYCDEGTGLRVDISFENSTGPKAIDTFLDWKQMYPAMPTLVAIIKHFLCMRGLNEPVNGGIGGFSVICMVVNLLHNLPAVQSRTMIPEHHLGELLMEFFKFYGKDFDYETVAISMVPPRLIPKHEVSDIVYRNMDRLSIIDPNNPENDISGGSSNFGLVQQNFSNAYDDLNERMHELAREQSKVHGYDTLLAPIFGGNYSSFRLQRNYMKKIAEQGVPAAKPNGSTSTRW
ncbi:hypothetical protein BX600DRAFT_274394 [Xylariales sp. PMI_506]|nr:hypothetical protein BX600DRAFT_274394 [Xylariales sp. PMI_506]